MGEKEDKKTKQKKRVVISQKQIIKDGCNLNPNYFNKVVIVTEELKVSE